MKPTLPVALALVILCAHTSQAAELKVLSAGAVEPGLVGLLDAFRRETGQGVAVAFATAPAIRRRVTAGETADVVIAPPAVLDDLAKAGRVLPEGRAAVGRVGVGVTVRSGAAVPDVSTPEALKQAVLRAEGLVYNEASTGIYFHRLLERLGVADQVKAKTTRYPDGASVFEHLLRGRVNEVGVGAMTEIIVYTKKGLVLVGPLPAEVQNYTTYAAAVMAGATSPEAARGLVRFLTSPQVKAAFAAAGIEAPQ